MNRVKKRTWLGLCKRSLAIAIGLAAFQAGSETLLSDVFAVAKILNEDAKASQAKIEDLVDETNKLYNEYKTVLKEIEGLRVYNRQLERQIDHQNREISTLNESISEVTVIQRQVVPLLLRMVEGLEQFIRNDMPFLLDERETRLEQLRSTIERADVSVSEKFSQVLRAFQIENEFGRTITPYTQEIEVAGQKRVVDVLQVGRVAVLYQTSDGEETGWFNKKTRQWEPIDDSYQASVRNGLKMARKQLTSGLFEVPVFAPEG